MLLALLIAGGGSIAVLLAPWLDLESDYGLPWLYQARGELPPPPQAVIVAIDELSAGELGLPELPKDWPRGVHAELVHALSSAGARVIVFDLTFEVPAAEPGQDQALALAFRQAGNVLVTDMLRKREKPLADAQGRLAAQLVFESVATPVEPIEQAVRGHAPFVLPKAPRVDSWWTFPHGPQRAPSLPVLVLQAWGTGTPQSPAPEADRQRTRRLLQALPALGDAVYLNFYGPPRSIRTLSYSDVLKSARGLAASNAAEGGDPTPGAASALAREVAGKAVFIGFSARTASGQDMLRDDHLTVYSRDDGLNLSGVELAATAFANLLQDRPLRPLNMLEQWAVLAAWSVALSIVCVALRPSLAIVAVALLMSAYLGWALQQFTSAGRWWPSIIPLAVQAPLALLIGLGMEYVRTQRERAAIQRAFGYFLPSSQIDELARGTGAITEGNRVVYGTCLSTDVSRYTSLAETMEPRLLGELLNEYFAELFVPVERTGGHVMDVVGDAMVAMWTAAVAEADVRRRACEAALDIVAAVDRFNRAKPGRPALVTRFGLHSGDVLIGHVGASQHYEYRAVGDLVNTASRLQALNKVLGTQLLASAQTVDGLPGLSTRRLGRFRLAGKAQELTVVELLSPGAATLPAAGARSTGFAAALACHDARQWHDAARQFEDLLQACPDDGPSRFYLERCRALAAAPPDPQWQPTVVLDVK